MHPQGIIVKYKIGNFSYNHVRQKYINTGENTQERKAKIRKEILFKSAVALIHALLRRLVQTDDVRFIEVQVKSAFTVCQIRFLSCTNDQSLDWAAVRLLKSHCACTYDV